MRNGIVISADNSAMRRSSQNQQSRGFTLIELLITVAVVGVLAAITYPAYQDQVRKSRRSAAQGILLQIANREQQLYLDARQYVAAADTAALASSNIRVGVDPSVQSAYGFSVTTTAVAGNVPTFTVTATPIGSQAADRCGTMSINEANVKVADTACGGTW